MREIQVKERSIAAKDIKTEKGRKINRKTFAYKERKGIRGNSPNKTDEKYRQGIADIMEIGNYLTVVIPEGTAAELRRLT